MDNELCFIAFSCMFYMISYCWIATYNKLDSINKNYKMINYKLHEIRICSHNTEQLIGGLYESEQEPEQEPEQELEQESEQESEQELEQDDIYTTVDNTPVPSYEQRHALEELHYKVGVTYESDNDDVDEYTPVLNDSVKSSSDKSVSNSVIVNYWC